MNKQNLLKTALCLFVMATPSAHAQNAAPADKTAEQPIEITADQSLEWIRGEKRFIARQNALAKQGESSIEAETLTAEYRDTDGIEIWRITAEGGVILRSRDTAAFGDKAVYDMDKGLATMTGNDLRMIAPDQTVRAKQRFDYWVEAGRFEAVGNATVIRPKQGGGEDRLQADTITATLKDDGKGKQVLDTLEAKGNVTITTPTETVTGATGLYNATTNTADLSGGVTIRRGPNILEGDRATVNLTTNTSQLFGGTTKGDGRVRGVFYPGSDKKP